MDPVTHTLIGVGIGNAFFREKIGSCAIPIMAIASNLPDVDALVHLTGSSEAILARRTIGHSMLTLPILALFLSKLFKRFWPNENFKQLYGMVLLGALTHVFFDLVNSFGVVLLWPLSDWRPELGIIFIIDLILTGLLTFPLLLCIPKKMRTYLVPLSKAAIVFVAIYTLFCGINRALALKTLTEEEDPSAQADFRYVFPEPFGPHRWRGVLRHGETYQVFLIHSLNGRLEPYEAVSTSIESLHVKRVKETPLAQRIEWFFKAPVWTVSRDEKVDNAKVGVYDLRFTSLLIDCPIPFLFKFHVDQDGQVRTVSK